MTSQYELWELVGFAQKKNNSVSEGHYLAYLSLLSIIFYHNLSIKTSKTLRNDFRSIYHAKKSQVHALLTVHEATSFHQSHQNRLNTEFNNNKFYQKPQKPFFHLSSETNSEFLSIQSHIFMITNQEEETSVSENTEKQRCQKTMFISGKKILLRYLQKSKSTTARYVWNLFYAFIFRLAYHFLQNYYG